MAEEQKNPTPQELAQCFIDQVSLSHDRDGWSWDGKYSWKKCIQGMDLTYVDKELGWTPLTVAIGRASYYFGQHRPRLNSLGNLYSSGRVSLDDLLKIPQGKDESALQYAAKYPGTFKRMLTFLFGDEETIKKYFEKVLSSEWEDSLFCNLRDVDIGKKLLPRLRQNPEYDEKRIFSPDFYKVVERLDSDDKMAYRHCPGFKTEWLLDDYRHFKKGDKNISDSTLREALHKFEAVLEKDPKLQPKVDELRKGVKGVNLEYSCYSHYQSGHFGGPRFYDYNGRHLTPDYLETLNQNFPNIESLTLPEYEDYKRQDFHNTLENEIGEAQFEAVSKFKKLKHLGVGYQPRMNSKAFDAIATMKNLESVSFDKMELNQADLDKLLTLPKLKELSLNGCKYDADLIRQKTNLLCVDGKWVGPKHPDYKKAKELEEERLAEIRRIESLTGKDWKEKFHEAMAEDRKYDAIEILKLNHVFDKRPETRDSSFGRDKPEDVGPHILQHWGVDSMTVRNDCLAQDIAELGGDNVAIANLYEDRDWHSNVGYSGGVGWYWKGEVAVVNLDKGVGEMAATDSLCVRHPTDPYRDIFDNINKKDILRVEDGRAIVRLGHYSSASVAVPEVSKEEDRQLRDKQAKKLKGLRSGHSLKKTLEEGQQGAKKALESARKFHAVRKQKTALK